MCAPQVGRSVAADMKTVIQDCLCNPEAVIAEFIFLKHQKLVIEISSQTVSVISVCNNQLLDWIENKLIRVISFIPGVASALPNIVAKLHAMKEKYMAAPLPVKSNIKVKSWDLSFASVWNTIVWLMLLNFFVKIVNSTAQRYLKKQQEAEISALKKNSEQSENSSH